MRSDLSVRAAHRGGMRVDVNVRGQILRMDYPAAGDSLPTPLEVLLASLAACAANTLSLVLDKRMAIHPASLEVEAQAERRTEHPTVLTEIELIYRLRGEPIDSQVMANAIREAEDHICPVLAMLRPGTSISSRWIMV